LGGVCLVCFRGLVVCPSTIPPPPLCCSLVLLHQVCPVSLSMLAAFLGDHPPPHCPPTLIHRLNTRRTLFFFLSSYPFPFRVSFFLFFLALLPPTSRSIFRLRTHFAMIYSILRYISTQGHIEPPLNMMLSPDPPNETTDLHCLSLAVVDPNSHSFLFPWWLLSFVYPILLRMVKGRTNENFFFPSQPSPSLRGTVSFSLPPPRRVAILAISPSLPPILK